MDRRAVRRRPCLVEATIGAQGESAAASIHDISERGCFAVTTLRCQPGHGVDIGLSRLGPRLSGKVIAQAKDGLHMVFTGAGLPAADADRISLTTIADLVTLTKADHTAFVKRVTDAVAGQQKLQPENLATQHQCRLGHWYDGVSDPETLALASFKAIAKPHHGVHEYGRNALAAVIANNMAAAQRHVAAMRRQSEEVLRGLDEFGQAYPATLGSERSTLTKAA